MDVIAPEVVARLRERYSECFACGRDNPIGLHLDGFQLQDGEVRASFDPRQHYRGFEDLLHGGIVATALDEIMAWTAILAEGVLVVTLTMDLRFTKPIAPDGRLEVAGRIDRRSGNRLRMRGEVRRDGGVLAEAAGLFLVRESVEQLIADGKGR